MNPVVRIHARRLAAVALVAALLAAPASARILKTKRPGQSAGRLALTIGSGFEYETDPASSGHDYFDGPLCPIPNLIYPRSSWPYVDQATS